VGQEPDQIRAEIEQTRAEMSDTVDALGYKADVKTRAKENLQGKKESAKESIVGVKDKVVGATPDSGEVKQKARRGASVAQQNPIGLAFGSVAVGFIAGLLIPATRVEDEKLGEVSDNVIEKAKETGQEALEHGKQVAQEAAQSAQETVKESGQEHAQQVKDSAQQSAQDVRQEPQGSRTYQTH
jgi:hypothetical protein